jgi:hypothetical protein
VFAYFEKIYELVLVSDYFVKVGTAVDQSSFYADGSKLKPTLNMASFVLFEA